MSDEIKNVWFPDPNRAEADRVIIKADRQYLKVSIEDDLGVHVELDQRSEGLQWLVSFFVVFFAEAEGTHQNAILLLDEPGLSLHGLKQRDFRKTISKLSDKNQTIYTTHSPFLVGPDELDLVRVVELEDRREGTKVHTTLSSEDPAALLPLQEALGYDLAQSLFGKKRHLVLEGLTDYWYLDAMAVMLREAGHKSLDDNIACLFAGAAGKVVYYATILHAQNLKVAALLDSDNAGEQAARQDELVYALGNKNILRTKDFIATDVDKPEIEDLLRETLIRVAKDELGWDIIAKARDHPKRSVVGIFKSEISGFSKYKLAKAFLRWARTNGAEAVTEEERRQWSKLLGRASLVLK